MAIGINLKDENEDDDKPLFGRHWLDVPLNPDVYSQSSAPIEKTLLSKVFHVCEAIPYYRKRYQVLAALMEEVGELATEVNIADGFSKKPAGKDGIIGEAVDVILCALDIIWLENVELTHEDLEDVVVRTAEKKLEKWRAKQ